MDRCSKSTGIFQCVAQASPQDGLDSVAPGLSDRGCGNHRSQFVQPRQEPVAEHTRVQFGDPGGRVRPAGYFARISGMSVELDDDAELRGGESVDTETGFGLSFGAALLAADLMPLLFVDLLV